MVACGAQSLCMAICHDFRYGNGNGHGHGNGNGNGNGPLHWLWLYPRPLPWDRASSVLLRFLFSCNLLGICMVDDGGDVFGSLRVDMGRLA